ncbi:hypothetical protein NW762_000807 [Fusarium torreyae]|uniref:2EXR domain-containing protein n=1 Tax=Fusarium torreyae TaxID=1237075 RepID=A0A9W8SH52_9HYPO|nr:hypothetical protein NW762_000807 [Fusarium torreyae]
MSISLHLANLPVGSYEVTVTNAEGTRISHNKIDLPAQIAGAATTFPHFEKLPAELRSKIWEHSIQNESRVFCPAGYDEDREVQHFSFAHKPPAIRQVCREARQMSKKHSMFIFGISGSTRGALWFNTVGDIIYNQDNEEADTSGIEPNYKDIMSAARNVALDFPQNYNWENLLESLVTDYRRCETLFLVLGCDEIPTGDIAFFSIPDDEQAWSVNIDDEETWGQVKENINKAWRKKKLLRKLHITEAQLPSIKVVEALPVRKKGH